MSEAPGAVTKQYDIDPHAATVAVMDATAGSYAAWEELGPNRTDLSEHSTGDFAAEATHLDELSEERQAEALRRLQRSAGVVVRFVSEERPKQGLDENLGNPGEAPNILAVGDGVDGSSNIFKPGQPYGSILTIAGNAHPTYDDFLATGIGMFGEGVELYAEKGAGTTVHCIGTGEARQVRTNQDARLGRGDTIYVDRVDMSKIDPRDPLYSYFELNTQIAEQLETKGISSRRTGSTAKDIFDVATGEVLASVQATRKGCLEYPAAYLAVKEAGGVVETVGLEHDGLWWSYDIGNRGFETFGQHEHVLTIAAANFRVANAIVCSLYGLHGSLA